MNCLIKANKKIFVSAVLIIVLLSATLFAQGSWQKLLTLYQNGQYAALKETLDQIYPKQKNSLEYLFFQSLFIKDAAQAVKNYQLIFEKSSDWLKSLAAQKLHDFYYAQGYYLKAKNYSTFITGIAEKDTKALPPDSYKADEAKYAIQLGAFSSMNNAKKRQEALSKNGINSQLVVRKINNRNYYCVWVKGSATLADTDKLAKQIKKQLNIDYRIIKE